MTGPAQLDRRSLTSLTALLITAPLFFLLLPLYVGALADFAALSSAQIGTLVSTELAGAMLTSSLGVFWIRRWRWQPLAAGAMAILCATNIASILALQFMSILLVVRFLAGAATGVGVSIALAGLGDFPQPGRSYGIAVTGQLSVAGIALVVLPPAIQQFGVAAVFVTFALASIVAASFFRWLPDAAKAPAAVRAGERVSSTLPFWGLAGSVCIFLAQTAVWAFTERMGTARGLSPNVIGVALGVAHIPAVAGALLSAWVGDRVSKTRLMVFCALGEVAAAALLLGQFGIATYVVATCAYQFCWTLWVPIQMAMVAESDVSGRYTVLLTAAQAAGVSIGPALAGKMIVGTDYTAVIGIGGVFALMGLAFFMPLLRRVGAARA